MIINVRVIPRAKINKVSDSNWAGFDKEGGRVLSKPTSPDYRLKLYTTAAPADGGANESVVGLLARHFHIAKSRVRILRGKTARDKVIEITGVGF